MKRVEIIANRSVEEDLMDRLAEAKLDRNYTKIPIVHGSGRQGKREGGAAWPEENFILVVYCEEAGAATIEGIVAGLKEHYPHEGIKLFCMG